MMQQYKVLHFMAACALVLAFFSAYQFLRGDHRNVAMASLGDQSSMQEGVQYPLAYKRALRGKLNKDIDNILDLSGHDVVQIFDAPELVRRDLPTTIWQYRSDACVLDVYFTVGNASHTDKTNVAYYEMRARDTRSKTPLNREGCLNSLLKTDRLISLIDIGAIYKASSE